jgi:hypothetical protein
MMAEGRRQEKVLNLTLERAGSMLSECSGSFPELESSCSAASFPVPEHTHWLAEQVLVDSGACCRLFQVRAPAACSE